MCSFSKALTERQAPARDEEACVEALVGCVRADRRSASGAVGWDEQALLPVVACAEALAMRGVEEKNQRTNQPSAIHPGANQPSAD